MTLGPSPSPKYTGSLCPFFPLLLLSAPVPNTCMTGSLCPLIPIVVTVSIFFIISNTSFAFNLGSTTFFV